MTSQYMEDFFRAVSAAVAKGSREVLCVAPEVEATGEDAVGFSYTVGNSAHKLPEFLIIGYGGDRAAGLLHRLSDILIERARPFFCGERVNLGGKFPVMILDAGEEARQKYTIQAGGFIGSDDYKVQQVVAPDPNGRFPDDPLCLPGYSVPLLRDNTLN
jgi:hypothetical protein